MPDIPIITIEAVPGTEIRIRLVPPVTTLDIGTVEGMLAELTRRGGVKIREIANGLAGIGYVPEVPGVRAGGARQTYLGWSDPARTYSGGAKFTLYLEPQTMSFYLGADRSTVSAYPGADTRLESHVAFRLAGARGVARAMAAARAVKR